MSIRKSKKGFINFIKRSKLKPKTKLEYINVFESIPSRILQRRDVSVYRDYLKGKSRKTIAMRLSVYRRYMKFMGYDFKDVQYITYDIDKKLKDSFTPMQVKSMVDISTDKFMKAVITILYFTGLRIGELLNSDLQIVKGSYRVSIIGKGKTKSETIILYKKKSNKLVIGALNEYFKPKHKHKKQYYYVWREFKEIKIRLGIDSPRLTLHSLRHSAAERFRRKYGDFEAMRMLRHRDYKTTEIYLNNKELEIR